MHIGKKLASVSVGYSTKHKEEYQNIKIVLEWTCILCPISMVGMRRFENAHKTI